MIFERPLYIMFQSFIIIFSLLFGLFFSKYMLAFGKNCLIICTYLNGKRMLFAYGYFIHPFLNLTLAKP